MGLPANKKNLILGSHQKHMIRNQFNWNKTEFRKETIHIQGISSCQEEEISVAEVNT